MIAREGSESLVEMQRKLERFQSAKSAVSSVAPVAGETNNALRQKLDAMAMRHHEAEAEAARGRAAVDEVSRALRQESTARDELNHRAGVLQGRKSASEATLLRTPFFLRYVS